MAFTESDIFKEFAPVTVKRAREIVKEKKLGQCEVKWLGDDMMLSARVEGSGGETYDTSLKLRPDASRKRIQGGSCTCLAYSKYSGLCKHCAALAYWYLAHQEECGQKKGGQGEKMGKGPAETPSSREIQQLIVSYGMRGAGYYGIPTQDPIRIELSLHSTQVGMEFELRVGSKRMYVVKDVIGFARAVARGETISYGKNLSFLHERSAFASESQPLLDLLLDLARGRFHNYLESTSYSQYRTMGLNAYELRRLLNLYIGRAVELDGRQTAVRDGDPALTLTIDGARESDGRYRLKMDRLTIYRAVGGDVILSEDVLYLCTPGFQEAVGPLLAALEADWKRQGYRQERRGLYISRQDYPAFCANVLARTKEWIRIESPGLSWEEYLPQQGEIKLYLDLYGKNKVCVRPEIYYGESGLNLLKEQTGHQEYHDIAKERGALAALGRFFTQEADIGGVRHLTTDGTDAALYRLLREGLEVLEELGEVYISDRMKKMRIARSPRVSAGVSLGAEGLLELDLDIGDFEPAELEALLAACRERRRFYRLKSGEFMELSDGSVNFLAELSAGLGLTGQDLGKQKIQVPAFRAAYLDAVIRTQGEDVQAERSAAFKQMLQRLREPEETEYEAPEGLNGQLRRYQKTGYRWLMVLSHYGLGGILADDMGLGKTIQVIALLMKRQELSLIVCPASLVYNWENELGRFAPGLSVVTVTGNAKERAERIASCGPGQVVVTSYDLLKRDLEHYQGIEFGYQIIDEAQYIKNAGTQAAQAVKSIRAARRFALTGTPIENRLSELWSIFDFIMPGYLYDYRKFREELELPIIQEEDKAALKQLQRLIRPFILRRVKKDVLKDLPEKVETVVYSQMTAEQKKLYQARLLLLKKDLEEKNDEEFSRDRIRVLAELVRLRQICCTPALCYEDYKGGSGKLDTFLDLVSGAVEGGHRLLVFSQFSQMLDMLEQCLISKRLRVLKLTGRDSKEKRRKLVDRFQDREADVFLISLKAGGTGLNLTAADMVIHYDPWWNVAAQDQATDRAHRIGQSNRVTVIRMVTKDTVEERILELQERKRELVGQVLSDGGFSNQILDRKELLEILGE